MIDQKDVEHIAKLARIELSDKEKETIAKEMSLIMGYIDKLNEVDISGVEPTAQVTGLNNIFRKDEVRQVSNEETVNKLHKAMPQEDNGYLKVKSVFKDR